MINTTTTLMISLENSDYFHPTKYFRQLSVMLVMHNEPDLRQQGIAERAGMSGAMVNGYIKQLRDSGYITTQKKNRRDLEYKLTEMGRELLVFHLMECSAEIVQLYGQAKNELVRRLTETFRTDEFTRVALYGGSETGRLVLESLKPFVNVKIVAVIDSDSEKWGNFIGQHVVQGPEILGNIEVDYIIISSFARQNEIYSYLTKTILINANILRLSSLQ